MKVSVVCFEGRGIGCSHDDRGRFEAAGSVVQELGTIDLVFFVLLLRRAIYTVLLKPSQFPGSQLAARNKIDAERDNTLCCYGHAIYDTTFQAKRCGRNPCRTASNGMRLRVFWYI